MFSAIRGQKLKKKISEFAIFHLYVNAGLMYRIMLKLNFGELKWKN